MPNPTESGGLICTVGAVVYPIPVSIILISVIVPELLIYAFAVAVIPIPDIPGGSILITGGSIYPDPPLVIYIIPTTPSAISAVASALFPPPPKKETFGIDVYPYPEFVISTP